MRRRGRTDANQTAIVKALRKAGCNVFITSGLGNGFADVIAYRPSTGMLRLLEIKDGDKPPSARKLTPDEEAFALLFPVWVVNDVKEALGAMGIEVA